MCWPWRHAARVIDAWQRRAPDADDDLNAELVLTAGGTGPDREPRVVLFGAVVPLLALAAHMAGADDESLLGRWLQLARRIGDRLCELASVTAAGAGWPTSMFPAGIGGLSHGATGIGWALSRLAVATGCSWYGDLAEAAFAREESRCDRRWLLNELSIYTVPRKRRMNLLRGRTGPANPPRNVLLHVNHNYASDVR